MEGLHIGVITELNKLAEKINDNPEHIQNEKNRVYQFNIDEIGPVQLLIKDGQVEVVKGTSHDPEVTLKLSEGNLSKLLKDELNTAIAFMTGGLKVDGNISLALKLQEFVKCYN
ncbi:MULTISPECIES: SCP2 sterol-binding domain-containing protein [unclassified Peribacillus]|uniref:SCP2 sterol-binding domain-containing protein n=1 Tax=unclassified Peribacillus TaxID=2675266 RepID=UPI001A920D64|nr:MULTISPECIES: SCP2 sterol-binding domain-containing protein [unclassified Peribacillus]WMX56594.1 SCP2 sterol-binding domain-containing protein [Peribacillus sp. R9-11]